MAASLHGVRQLTWQAETPESRRRKRAFKACNACHQRKKRCIHLADLNADDETPGPHPDTVPPENSDGPGPGRDQLQPNSKPRPSPAETTNIADGHGSPPKRTTSRSTRFVGDLNPQAALLGKLDAQADKPQRDRVGFWVSSPSAHSDDGSDEDSPRPNGRQPAEIAAESVNRSRPDFHARQLKHGSLHGAVNLPKTTQTNLISLYFAKVHPILPLLDQESFLQAQSAGESSPWLVKAVCLVAAKHEKAASHLRLAGGGPLKPSREFCFAVYTDLVRAMNGRLVSDRITRIRILALMSLHFEGCEGSEVASMHLCQAIHHAQTAGLHLGQPSREGNNDALEKLFWSLWSLDKMHASIGGRPVMMADRDIGISRVNRDNTKRRTAFDIWLAISDILAEIISFYRPSADSNLTGWETGFPTFESVVGDDVAEDLDFSTLSLLELFYHSTGILSCRSDPTGQCDRQRPSYTRQCLSTVRIQSIIASECPDDMPPLPIIPYALSLSMSVSYQQLRQSKLITQFNRANASLRACCGLLERLSRHWWSAEAMARLGRKALRKIADANPQRSRGQRASPPSRHTESSEALPVPTLDALVPDLSGPDSGIGGAGTLPVTRSERQSESTGQPVLQTQEDFAAFGPWIDDSLGGLQPNGFQNIDNLFGEYLDLSLPTNFWDPIFTDENLMDIPVRQGGNE